MRRAVSAILLTGALWTIPGGFALAQAKRKNVARRIRVTAWFDKQFLEDGTAYRRRAEEFKDSTRSKMRVKVIQRLKALSATSHKAASADLHKLVDAGTISDLRRYWIINGFTCTTTTAGLPALRKVAGVKEVYVAGPARASRPASRGTAVSVAVAEKPNFDPDRYQHPWYIRYLQADRVWKELGVTGRGTLNVVHDFNFVYSQNVTGNLYRNPGETAGNGKDDDGNGLIDDVHGYNFDQDNANLTLVPVGRGGFNPRAQHGFMCAAIICGTGAKGRKYEFGIAPEGTWTGVIASGRLEAAIEWAVEQGADTYSMSFSIPGLGEYRSHWRKVMEHGSFCGMCFVSGAGNFAQQARVPVQMRTPEDIPNAVFAAAGVQRNFSRTPFSSQGPVEWKTRHYQDGRVQARGVCLQHELAATVVGWNDPSGWSERQLVRRPDVLRLDRPDAIGRSRSVAVGFAADHHVDGHRRVGQGCGRRDGSRVDQLLPGGS